MSNTDSRTEQTAVEVDVEPLQGGKSTVELSKGDEQTFTSGTVAFTVRVLEDDDAE